MKHTNPTRHTLLRRLNAILARLPTLDALRGELRRRGQKAFAV